MAWKREYAPPKPQGFLSDTLTLPRGALQIESAGSRWVIWPKFPDGDTNRVGIWVKGDDLDQVEHAATGLVADALEALAADLRAIDKQP